MTVEEFTGLSKIEKFSDLLKLNDFVYSAIPWKKVPDEEWLKESYEDRLKKIESILQDSRDKKIGGWCGASGVLMSLLLAYYKIKRVGLNYGLSEDNYSHVVVIANLDGMEFLLDPYFNRHYTYYGEFPLQFPDLIRLIEEKKFAAIKSVYGSSSKEVEQNNGYIQFSPQSLEESVIKSWYNRGFKKELINTYGVDNSLMLLLNKID